LRLHRAQNEIELVDDYALKTPAKLITLTLMTCCAVKPDAPGKLSLGDRVTVLYDAAAFTPAVEEIRIEDARLRSAWGDKLYRILLRAENPPQRAAWTARVTKP
jgi:hypothetical protein